MKAQLNEMDESVSRRGALAALAGFVALAYLPALIGTRFLPGAWYRALSKPAWTPPDWLFGPVWSLLYLSIGVAAWLVWRRRRPRPAPAAWGAWAVQLALNAAWSWLFFGLQRPALALAEIAALWLAVLATVVLFWRLRPAAGLLLVPYLGWVGFAAALNFELWRLNP